MWLKLEFPLAGEAEKQENRGRGKKEKERERGETNSSQFTQEKGLLAHLCHSQPFTLSLNYKASQQTHTDTHTH